MSAIRQNNYGMLTGKKVFFHGANNTVFKSKIIQILQRLEAVVEPFFNSDIDMIITDDDDENSVISKKRKFSTPLPYRCKKLRLISGAINTTPVINRDDEGQSITKGDFLAKAISMGCKIKTMKGIWSWLSQFYGHLVENCYVENSIICGDAIDEQYKVKNMSVPAIKILDPFGGYRPLVHDNCALQVALFAETAVVKRVESLSTSRRSNGTGRVSHHKVGIETTGYCECCLCNFSSTYSHITDTCHQSFAKNSENFSGLDKILLQVSDIDKFFKGRLSLQQKYRDSKLAAQPNPRSNSKAALPSPKKSVVADPQACILKSGESSSSSGSSSSGPTTDDSSDCSSEQDNECPRPAGAPITSTPLPKRLALASFLRDSISNEDVEQSELSQHVEDIVSHLSLLELPHLTSKVNDSDVEEMMERLEVKEQYRGLFLPERGRTSFVISQRFNWCLACGRNHVPAHEHEYQCQLGHTEQADNLSLDEAVFVTPLSPLPRNTRPGTDIDLDESLILHESEEPDSSYDLADAPGDTSTEAALSTLQCVPDDARLVDSSIGRQLTSLSSKISLAHQADLDLPGSIFSSKEDESESLDNEHEGKSNTEALSESCTLYCAPGLRGLDLSDGRPPGSDILGAGAQEEQYAMEGALTEDVLQGQEVPSLSQDGGRSQVELVDQIAPRHYPGPVEEDAPECTDKSGDGKVHLGETSATKCVREDGPGSSLSSSDGGGPGGRTLVESGGLKEAPRVAVCKRAILTARRVRGAVSGGVALTLQDHFTVLSLERSGPRPRRTAAIVANLCIEHDYRVKEEDARRWRGADKEEEKGGGSAPSQGERASPDKENTDLSVLSSPPSTPRDSAPSESGRRRTLERSVKRRADKTPQLGPRHTDSPGRAQRAAAVFANHGIRNTNRLMNSNVDDMMKCLEKSYVPHQYDPRVRLNNLKFSPEQTKTRKKVLKENNQ